MQIYFKQNLAFLAVPKTGTTAIEMALRPNADIVFSKGRKHLNAGTFHLKVAPFLRELCGANPERMAVMRDPITQIRSWFRYRGRKDKAGGPLSTEGISFDEFVRAVISDNPPPFAGLGTQYDFLSMSDGRIPVHRLFAYEDRMVIHGFLEERFQKELDIKARNVSPPIEAPLSPDVERALRRARANEFDLHARIRDAGGQLRQFAG